MMKLRIWSYLNVNLRAISDNIIIIMGDISWIDKGIVTDLLILLLYLKIRVLKILFSLVLAVNVEIERAGMWYYRVQFNMLVHILTVIEWVTEKLEGELLF